MKIIDILKSFIDNPTIIIALIVVISFGFNIFQFARRRKIDKIDLKKKIKLKEIEIEKMRDRHKEEQRQLESQYEGEIRRREFSFADLRTPNDRRNADSLFNRQGYEDKKLYTELFHLQELAGEGGVLVPLSRGENIKYGIKRFFNKAKRKLVNVIK